MSRRSIIKRGKINRVRGIWNGAVKSYPWHKSFYEKELELSDPIWWCMECDQEFRSSLCGEWTDVCPLCAHDLW